MEGEEMIGTGTEGEMKGEERKVEKGRKTEGNGEEEKR